jgi:hypothetical protein
MKKKDNPVNFMNIKDVTLSSVCCEFYQSADSCQDKDVGQVIKIFTENAGGGTFAVIETERWSVDADDIDKLIDCIKRIVAMPED